MMRVMIVDDHSMLRRGVRSLVESKPCYEVVGEAEDGFVAMEVATATQPDIAIVDYSLPKRNGLALAQALKKEMPRLEIVLFTLHDEEELVIEALRAGVRGFVLKSESEKHLLHALDAVSIGRSYFSSLISDTLIDRYMQDKLSASDTVLSHRELEVVQLIAEGQINKQIAHSLSISIKTVETHRASAMRKLNLRTTADLVRYAVRNNIVQA